MAELIALVTFTSLAHQIWFVGSMLLLLIFCSAVLLGFNQQFHFLAILHAIVAVEAIFSRLFRPEDTEVFSVHCIWFNLLMAIVYIFLTDSAGTGQLKDDETKNTDGNEAN
ncbi:MAG: hypothetical protein WCT10_03800 [Patescibacteria group bacterium]